MDENGGHWPPFFLARSQWLLQFVVPANAGIQLSRRHEKKRLSPLS
jgi:hypothetical protein